jgi:pimeloyl-ACP methyl ester carboxylesterase
MITRRKTVAGLIGALGTAPFRPSLAATCPARSGESIREQSYVTIGGIDQWIEIMGSDRSNPVLLVLNGGPGSTWDPFTDLFRDWEDHFTMVYWSQRGAGKTYRKSGETVASTMTIPRMVDDGIEVANYLRDHLQKKKILILGHSWGTLLGIKMIQKRPNIFSAYVGTGQIVNMVEGEKAGLKETIRRAKAANRSDAVNELRALGEVPYDDIQKLVTERKWAGVFDTLSDAAFDKAWRNPEWFTKADASERYKAWLFSNFRIYDPKLENGPATIDFMSSAIRLEVPIIIIDGAEDHITPSSLAVAYERKLKAPRKFLSLLPGGGHNAIFAMKDAFLKTMLEQLGDLAC